jgi:acetoin utilization deacetylase AcuC-like enzyme
MKTGWICHERYFWHDQGSAAAYIPAGGFVEPELHVDNPTAKRRFRNLVEVSGLSENLISIKPRYATYDEIELLHDYNYINRVIELSKGRGGDAGQNALVGPNSYEIACLAVGGCISAVNSVLDNQVDNCYALVRPPGHHAEPKYGRGYCIFGNSAIAVLQALERKDVDRVAIVDWDVHHGNGTQVAFYDNPSVLTISIHQDRLFPHDMGLVSEIGSGPGEGFNINIPLPPGSGSGAYQAVFQRVVRPALDIYQPDLIVVSCGFDPCAIDPLSRQLLYSEDFRFMTREIMRAAADHCDNKLVICQEGGYSTAYLPFCGLAVLEELSGISTGIEDPFMEARNGVFPYSTLQAHQKSVINEAEKNVKVLKNKMH